jgi:formylglycine-generating enzyme required for sulfatase activity
MKVRFAPRALSEADRCGTWWQKHRPASADLFHDEIATAIEQIGADEAYAFCIWDGGFLPSEAEWECAAAGGPDQREYPWGSTDPGTANLYDCADLTAPATCGSHDSTIRRELA